MKKQKQLAREGWWVPIRVGMVLVLFGVLCRLLHWPFADLTLMSGAGAILVFYTLRYSSKRRKDFLDFLKLMLVLLWSTKTLLTAARSHDAIWIDYAALMAFVLWLLLDGFRNDVKVKRQRSNLQPALIPVDKASKRAFSVCAGLTFVGVIFLIMHWNGAQTLLILGLGGASLWLLKDTLKFFLSTK